MSGENNQERSEQLRIALLGGLSIVSGALFVYGMKQNGAGAVKRYNALLATDEAGGDVDSALNDLRSFIYAHMNTEIGGENSIYPPIQLKGTYERLKQAEETRVKTSNDNLYTEAQLWCEQNGNQGFSGRNRLDCINGYIDEHGTKAGVIQDSLYKFDFVSPRWSPDLAGFSLIVFAVSILAMVVQLSMYVRTRYFIHLGN
ncbi:MAG TPA: hypothetical protein PKD20_02965 [Candidatus Saccharibacteria bacterium]|jgi:hypothetical protein|nr:hypothetical protein [Candidatus Saccharibacteria bacterium]HMT55811.1 hypothetical protein [Candidatus Saccharibacteria bacterium]